jgi:hypothetical protein
MYEEGKKQGFAITVKTGKILADKIDRRPWHKPLVTQIEIQRTMFDSGSLSDGDATGSL